MARLKIVAIADDAPVKLSIVSPAAVHRDLVSYAQAMKRESDQAVEPTQLIGPMLLRFMATDRAFAKWRRGQKVAALNPSGNDQVLRSRLGEVDEQ